MAKARVIVKRRKAVRNIRKITKVMQMIATSQYQKAFKRATGTKPYVKKIGELVGSAVQALQASGNAIEHPLMQAPNLSQGKKTGVLVISSNRGLCGGYNGNVLRFANHLIKELEEGGDSVELEVSGKKGIAFFRFAKRKMNKTFTNLGDNPKFKEIEAEAERYMEAYKTGKITGLKVVYMRFISPGQQKVGVVDLLPLAGLAAPEQTAQEGDTKKTQAQFDFLPSPEGILEELIPTVVKITLFQAYIEAVVSEQIARMIAMKAATDNADKLGKKLTQDYNRARQGQITSELSELMGGVEALK